MSRMVWPKIRQTEKARIFDGTALSLVYPGAIPTPLLPLIGWIFEKVVDSINGSRGETELCSFVYFIYVTICLVYVKKKESKNQFFLFWGTSSCRSRSGFVRCNESVATDTSLVPTQFQPDCQPKRRKAGRPKNEDQEQAFSKMCAYFELNDDGQLTVSALRCKMQEYLSNADSIPYGNQYLKTLPMQRYANSIFIAEGDGLDCIVTIREKTSDILRSTLKQKSLRRDAYLKQPQNWHNDKCPTC